MFGSGKLKAGETYKFNIVVAPIGMPGRTIVEEASGHVVVEDGDTREMVEEELKNRTIAMWHRDNPRQDPSGFVVTSFSLR